jgi:hypothetical protein
LLIRLDEEALVVGERVKVIGIPLIDFQGVFAAILLSFSSHA